MNVFTDVRDLFREVDEVWVAHRGASAHLPENTLPAFERAVASVRSIGMVAS